MINDVPFIAITGSALYSPATAADVDVWFRGHTREQAAEVAQGWAAERGLGHLPLDIHAVGAGGSVPAVGPSDEIEVLVGTQPSRHEPSRLSTYLRCFARWGRGAMWEMPHPSYGVSYGVDLVAADNADGGDTGYSGCGLVAIGRALAKFRAAGRVLPNSRFWRAIVWLVEHPEVVPQLRELFSRGQCAAGAGSGAAYMHWAADGWMSDQGARHVRVAEDGSVDLRPVRRLVLGAADHEMDHIVNLFGTVVPVIYASCGGHRVLPATAYRADSPAYEDGDLWVECSREGAPDARVRYADHHRPGDAGYGVDDPYKIVEASSLAQVCRALHRRLFDRDRLIAAMDHALGIAAGGGVPGVPRGTVITELARREQLTREELVTALRILAEGTRIRTSGEGRVVDLSDYIPMLPQEQGEADAGIPGLRVAALVKSVAYIAPVRTRAGDPNGPLKIVIGGVAAPAAWFVENYAPSKGLTNVYGDPARGFASGYMPEPQEGAEDPLWIVAYGINGDACAVRAADEEGAVDAATVALGLDPDEAGPAQRVTAEPITESAWEALPDHEQALWYEVEGEGIYARDPST